MIVTQKISLDLSVRDSRQTISAKQEDSMTRAVEISLLKDGSPWPIPSDATVFRICYAKPDRTGGCYERLENGTIACTKAGNVVTAHLHSQMFTCPGTVACELQMLNANYDRISTFTWYLQVEESPLAKVASEDYFQLSPMAQIGELGRLLEQTSENLEAELEDLRRQLNMHRQTESEELERLSTELQRQMVKKVNGCPPDYEGQVHLDSNSINMSDGDYGWAGLDLTEAMDACMASIPSDQKIKALAQEALPGAEGVVFYG